MFGNLLPKESTPIHPFLVFSPVAYAVPEAAESVMKSLRENVFIKPMFFKLKIVNVL